MLSKREKKILSDYETLVDYFLFKSAKEGDCTMICHVFADKVIDSNMNTLLHILAKEHDEISVLLNENAPFIHNIFGFTPLHYLAINGNVRIITNPFVSLVKDNSGFCPLHYLAIRGVIEASEHPDFHTILNNFNETPFDLLNTKK